MSSPLFEEYYQKQHIVRDDEWELFLTTLKRVLPVSLRINALDPLAPMYVCLPRSQLQGAARETGHGALQDCYYCHIFFPPQDP